MTNFLLILNLFFVAYLLGGQFYLQDRLRRNEAVMSVIIKLAQVNAPLLVSTLQGHQTALKFLGKALGEELALQEIEKFSTAVPTQEKH